MRGGLGCGYFPRPDDRALSSSILRGRGSVLNFELPHEVASLLPSDSQSDLIHGQRGLIQKFLRVRES